MPDPNLNPCTPGYIKDLNFDPIPPYCRDEPSESLHDVAGRDLSWLLDQTQRKKGDGDSALCDPMQTGHIINEQDGVPPDRDTVYRYSRSLRGCDEAMMAMFRDIVVIDEQGKAHHVPIIWGTQEKAVLAILQENFRKDHSLVVDRIRLPMLAIHGSEETFDQSRYIYHRAIDFMRARDRHWKPGFTIKEKHDRDTVFGVTRGIPINKSYNLYAWSLYREDMNQIVEQIILKFSPIAYIRVRGVSWEVGVKLDSIGNNIEVDPGDQAVNVFKYQFTMTAETFVPQPLVRRKAVLRTRTEVVDTVEDMEVGDVIARIEEAIKELQ